MNEYRLCRNCLAKIPICQNYCRKCQENQKENEIKFEKEDEDR